MMIIVVIRNSIVTIINVECMTPPKFNVTPTNVFQRGKKKPNTHTSTSCFFLTINIDHYQLLSFGGREFLTFLSV